MCVGLCLPPIAANELKGESILLKRRERVEKLVEEYLDTASAHCDMLRRCEINDYSQTLTITHTHTH